MIKHLLIILLLCVGKIHAANLHAIFVCDTFDDQAGDSLRGNYDLMRERLSSLEKKMEMKVHLQSFIGNDATPKKVLQAVRNLKVSRDDMVFFYFAGHGFRTYHKGGGLPYMSFSITGEACDFYAITQQLIDKEPRMLISLSDCCNGYIPTEFAPKIIKKPFIPKKAVKTLFTNCQGILIGTGARPGKYAYYARHGSFFTLAFLDSLEKELSECKDVHWEGVIGRIHNQVQNDTFYEQNPYCFFFDEKPSKKFKLRNYAI